MNKSKILAKLKTRFASRGFSKETLEGLADYAAKNLTDEATDDDITNAVSGLDTFAELMQRESNRMVTAATKKYDGYVAPDDPRLHQQAQVVEPAKPAMTAEEIAALIKSGIEEGMKPYRERDERTRLANLLGSHDKVKSIPQSFRQRYTLDDESKLDEVAAQIENDYTALKQEIVKSGEFITPPTAGQGAGGGEETSDSLIEFMQGMNETK